MNGKQRIGPVKI